jgi:phosphatidylserine decarboxylase
MLDDYGTMLKSEKSLKYFHSGEKGLMSKEILALVDYDDFDCDRTLPNYGFKSWNDWFTRSLRRGARPVADMDDPSIIVHAA